MLDDPTPLDVNTYPGSLKTLFATRESFSVFFHKNLSEHFLKFMSDVETAEKPGSDVETVEEPGSANYDKWHGALLQRAVQ